MRHSLHSVFFDQAESHEAAERYEEALALYYQVHRWAPQDAELWLRMGVLSFLTTDAAWLRRVGKEATHLADMGCVNAELYLDRAVGLAPESPQARFWRGWVRHRLYQDADGARADLAASVGLSPRFAYAHAAIARVALAEGAPDAAAEALERAVAALPESARLHYDLGACRARLGQLDSARAAFRRAMNGAALSPPQGVGGRYLADEFHAEPGAIAELVGRYYPDVLA